MVWLAFINYKQGFRRVSIPLPCSLSAILHLQVDTIDAIGETCEITAIYEFRFQKWVLSLCHLVWLCSLLTYCREHSQGGARGARRVCVSLPLGWGAPAFVLRSAYWTNQGQLSHNPNFGSIFLRNASTVKGPVYHTLLIKCFLGSHFFWIQERRKSLSWSQRFLVNIFFYVCVSMCTWTYTHKCIHKYTYSHIYREGKKYVQTLEICTAKYQQWLSVSDRTMTRFYFLPICPFIFSQ